MQSVNENLSGQPSMKHLKFHAIFILSEKVKEIQAGVEVQSISCFLIPFSDFQKDILESLIYSLCQHRKLWFFIWVSFSFLFYVKHAREHFRLLTRSHFIPFICFFFYFIFISFIYYFTYGGEFYLLLFFFVMFSSCSPNTTIG